MSSSQSVPPESLETTGKLSQSRSELVRQKASRIKPLDPRRMGLHKLYEPEEIEDIEVDILAIHGIGANPEHTWVDRKTQVNWLKDPTMLPDALPNARIMTYNYESYWFGENAVKQSLRGVAEKLLRAITEARSECLDRPIILIGHCFGGLVALECYVVSAQHPETYEGLSNSIVAGMMFLGTPFAGISHDSGMTKVGEVYQAIAASEVHLEDNVLETIAENNDILVAAVSDFVQYLGSSSNLFKAKLFCFWETKASKIGRVAGLNDTKPKFLVNESSGTIAGHAKEGLYKDHFAINKFVGKDDDNYKVVLRELKKMHNNAMELIEARRTDSLEQAQPTQLSPMQSRVPPISKENNFAERNGIINFIGDKLSNGPCVALHGEPGNGKTHVAVEYAHRYSKDSQGRVHWVNAGSAAGFESSYKWIADTRGINREGMRIDEVLESVYKSLSQDSSWLMVLDGCSDEITRKTTSASGSKKPLLDYVPKTGHARVLATTRSKEIAMQIVGNNLQFMKKVRKLEDADAALLMLGETTDLSKRAKAASRAKELGGSAATLVLAHLYQKKAKIDSKKYIERIQKVQTEDTSKTMRAWRLLYDPTEEKYPEAAHLLLQMGSMDVQCVPNEILKRDQLSKQVPKLESYGMVEPSTDKRVVIVTPIIRECIQKYLDENGEPKLVEGQMLDLLSSKLHSYEHRSAEVLLPCALAAFKFRTIWPDHTLKFAALHTEVAKIYMQIKQDDLAVHHWEQAIIRYEENPDSNQSQIEGAKMALKKAREGAHLNETDLTVTRAVTSQVPQKREGDSSNIVREHYNSARDFEGRGEYGRAEKHYVEALRVAELNYGPEGIIAMQIMGKLASMHNKQGQQKNAEQVLQATLLRQQKALGADHPDTLKTRREMAMLLADKGHTDAADDELKRVLITQLQLLGLENQATLQTGRALAMNYGMRGLPEEAESLLKETLGIQKRVLGETHADTTITAVNLKELLEQMKTWKA